MIGSNVVLFQPPGLRRGTKDIVGEAVEAFASYRGLGKDIIDDLIQGIIDARMNAANLKIEVKTMRQQRDHALSEQNEAIKQRDEWMARHMDVSLQRDAYREMATLHSLPTPRDYEG